MKGETDKDIGHFKIDGTIHDDAVSPYIDQRIEVSKQKQRMLLVTLSVLCFALFIWAAISQYRYSTMEKEIAQTKRDKKNIKLIKEELALSDRKMDSLENVVYRLKSENDYLAENSSKSSGIFFEVQLGSYEKSNLTNYADNLQNLRETTQNGRSLLLLGRFRSFKEALLFEKELKQLGINNAFVVGSIDSKIVPYQEALDAQNQSNN